MAHGGKRQGAGRPKGSKDPNTLKAELYRSYLIDEVIKEKEALVKAQIREAIRGNAAVQRELNDRVLGKPISVIDPGTGDAVLPFAIIVKQKD